MLRRVLGSFVILLSGVAIVLAIAWIQVRLEQRGGDDEKEVLEARLVAEGAEGAASLALSATAAWSRLPLGAPLSLSVMVVNRGLVTIGDVTAVASFQDAGSRSRVPLPICSQEGAAPQSLAPGQTLRFCGELATSRQHEVGQRQAGVVVSWQQEGAARAEMLVLGPVSLFAPADQWWALFSSRAVELLKSLALPVVLLLFGWLLKQHQADRQRAEETWNLILQTCQENAEQFYMPIRSSVTSLVRVESRRAVGDEARESSVEAFFYFVTLLCHTWALWKERGMFLLRDRQGERLVSVFAGAYLDAGRRLGLPGYWNALRSTDRYSTMVDLEERLRTRKRDDQELHRYYRSFEEWRGRSEYKSLLQGLEAFGIVLEYETNVFYYDWYREKERFPFDELWSILREMESGGQGDAVREPEMEQELSNYLTAHAPLRFWWARWRRTEAAADGKE